MNELSMKHPYRFAACLFVSACSFLFASQTTVSAASNPSIAVRNTTAGATQVVQTFIRATSTVVSTGKQYTEKKKGISLTLPTGWVKDKPTVADTLFLAKKGKYASWSIAFNPLSSKEEAATLQKYITAQPAKFAKAVRASFEKQFTSCKTVSAKKRTIGKFTGAEGVYFCTLQSKTYALSYFGFIRSTTQYAAVTATTKDKYTSVYKEYDSIMKSVTLFTPSASSVAAKRSQ